MNRFIKYQPLKNIAYLLNPKVACSTFQNSLLQGKEDNVHDINNFPIYNNPHVPVFTVVRNPFDRAVSGYLDKVVSRKDNVVWANFTAQLGLPLNYDISFLEYLQILKSCPNLESTDKHFRPQFYNFHGVKPSFIGYMESMDDVAEYLKPYGVQIMNKIPHKTNTAEKKAAMLKDEQCVELIKELYKVDFDAFGYNTDPTKRDKLEPIVQEQYVPDHLVAKHVNIINERTADVLREATLRCGDDNNLAFELIALARKIRPSGPVIEEMYKKLEESLKKTTS